jgi:polyhydroxybutyrate depolymerase
VGFIARLLDLLTTKYGADPNRIFVAGQSNGSWMTFRLACELSDRIAAIAAVAGQRDDPACRPVRPLSVLEIHGTADPIVPYQGGRVVLGSLAFTVPAVADAISFWAKHNGCPPEPTTSMVNAVVEKRTFGSCRDGTEVTLYTVNGGMHCWPGVEVGTPGCPRGGPHMTFEATPLIVPFPLAHPKSSKP